MISINGTRHFRFCRLISIAGLLTASVFAFSSCSFDYGSLAGKEGASTPDIVMTDLEYVRVRNGKPVVLIQADSLERYESDQKMVLESPRFKQLTSDGSDGAIGSAGKASINLATGDVSLSAGVRISIPEEKAVIESEEFSWKDKKQTLSGSADKAVLVKKEDGSYLIGTGFFADAQRKEWELSSGVSGSFVEEDSEEEAPAEDEQLEADAETVEDGPAALEETVHQEAVLPKSALPETVLTENPAETEPEIRQKEASHEKSADNPANIQQKEAPDEKR